MSDKNELLACPFCGGKPRLTERGAAGYSCCGGEKHPHRIWAYGSNEAEARSAWNTRPHPALPEEREKLVEWFDAMESVVWKAWCAADDGSDDLNPETHVGVPNDSFEALGKALEALQAVVSTSSEYVGTGALNGLVRAVLSAPTASLPDEEAVGRVLDGLRRLAVFLAAKHYPEGPRFEPLGDALGILSQIDNMTTGLVRDSPGYVAVPIEPTEEMIEAGCEARNLVDGTRWTDGTTEGVQSIERMLVERMWPAMLAASPYPPGGIEGQ